MVDLVVMIKYVLFFFFFFSSRRRHTRSKRDWSSDVCSSDLAVDPLGMARQAQSATRVVLGGDGIRIAHGRRRSEERRVGKEWRCWWGAGHLKESRRKRG